MTIVSSLRAFSLALAATSLLASAGCSEVVVPSPSGSFAGGRPGSSVSTGSAFSQGAGGAATTGGSGTSSAATSSAGTGGAGTSSAGAGGSAECLVQPGGESDFNPSTCDDLAVLAVSHPLITDADGDGLLEVGESATLDVNLDEVAGLGFNAYPGVYFESATAGVTVSSTDWFYAISACQTYKVHADITVAADVVHGTVATLTARAGMLGQVCPDAPAISIPIQVH